MGASDRKLHALIGADRPIEYLAIRRIGGGRADEPLTIPDRFTGNQQAFRIERVHQILEALAFLADQIVGRYVQIVDEHLVRMMVEHRPDRGRAQAVAGLGDVNQKQRQAVGLALDFGNRGGPGHDQVEVRLKVA